MSSSLIFQRFYELFEECEVFTNSEYDKNFYGPNADQVLQFWSVLRNLSVTLHPEKCLGPNYKKVLEFWEKIEKLTQEQLRVVEERYEAFFDENYSEWDESIAKSIDASEGVVGWKYAYNARWAAWDVTNSWAAYCATGELVGNVANPTFLPMFDVL